MKAVRWTVIAMLTAIGLTALGIALSLLWRGAIVPQMLLLFAEFSLILSYAAYIVAALATWRPKTLRRTHTPRK